MVKLLLLLFLIIFAVAGVCDFIYILRMLFFCPFVRVQNYLFIVLKKGNALKQLNYMWQKIKWYGDEMAIGIIAIIDDIENDELIDCNKFVDKKNIVLCNNDSLSEIVRILGS